MHRRIYHKYCENIKSHSFWKAEYRYSKCKQSKHQTKKPNSLIKLKPSKKASFKCQPSVITGLWVSILKPKMK